MGAGKGEKGVYVRKIYIAFTSKSTKQSTVPQTFPFPVTQTEADGSNQLGQMESQLGEQQLRAELATARREVGELRRLLLERESEARLNMLKVTTLQRTLQDRQHEVRNLILGHRWGVGD